MEKMNGKTMDIVGNNIKKLKEIFPDVFSEGKIDFEALKANLGEAIETEQERYSFNWNGKQEAKLIAQTPSTGTLRPCKEDSKDWDTTENLYIEGDNLEVLKLLQKSYHNKIKMIYIDPPYNTGNDFVYKDNFKDNIKNYMEQTGQVDTDGNKLTTNSDQSGRYHSNWLNMMYPRLKLARNLLTDDGVIFISIDDNEVQNLRKLCDEIFGEDNYVQEIIWEKKFAPQNDAKYFSLNHEQILCYSKNKDLFKRNLLPMTKEQKERYKNLDDDPRGAWQSDNLTVATYNAAYDYAIITPSGKEVKPTEGRCWSSSKDKLQELINDNRIWFGKTGENVPRLKRFLHETQQGRVPISIWSHNEVGHTQSASQELKKLFNNNKYFDFPKPIELIKKCLYLSTGKNDIVLDFFSGSATIAHASMQLNSEDDGARKYICVQLPEETDTKTEAYKAGYKNICEIGIERIRRAGEKIKEELTIDNVQLKMGEEKKESNLDIGFKVFKLDSSNIKEWDNEYAKENIAQSLFDHVDNIKSDRTEEDILFELLLKHGLDLTTPIDKIEIDGKKIFNIGGGTLYICLANGVNISIAERILEEHKILESPRVSVIFKDTGFINDIEKTNVIQTLKVAGITDVKSV